MPGATTCAADRTVRFLTTPALWPAWPFLPVVRRTNGAEQLGVLFDSRSGGLTGLSSVVFLTNLFLLPATWEEFLKLPRETYDGAEEVSRAGWRVD